MEISTRTSSTSNGRIAWVERLFQIMSASYGSHFTNLWRDQDIAAVKQIWAVELAKLSGDEVKAGVENLSRCAKPPTLPEFVAHCKTCRREQSSSTFLRLSDASRASPETIEANMPRMRAAVAKARACSPSAKWAYEMLIRGCGKNGAAMTYEALRISVDAVISWAGGQVIENEIDPDMRAKYVAIRKQCIEERS